MLEQGWRRMRIAGIELKGHPGVGHLVLDFRTSSGGAARTVILAGENGCGKTAILEAIYYAISPTEVKLNNPKPVRGLGRVRVFIEPDGPNVSTVFSSAIPSDVFGEIKSRWPDFDGIVIEINGIKKNTPPINKELYYNYYRMNDSKACLGATSYEGAMGEGPQCFYSVANISFDVPTISSIGASLGLPTGPNSLAARVRGSASLGAEIAQMLVNLQSADDSDTARFVREYGEAPPVIERDQRIKTFAEAFSKVVTNKQYIGFETDGNEHRPMFQQGAFKTPLAGLSTGEKQIIFRGAFLLRELKNLPGSVVLIDEPELSLHPTWQANVMRFYDEIVTESEKKKSQVIVATHSPFLVHGSPAARHIVLRRDAVSAAVSVDAQPSYPGANATEVAIAAFDLSALPFGDHAKPLALIVEGPTDQQIIETAWRKLRLGATAPFVLLAANGAKGVQNLLGSDANSPGPAVTALNGLGTKLIAGLWDFDPEGYQQWNGAVKSPAADIDVSDIARGAHRRRRNSNVWAMLLPVPSYRSDYATLDPQLAPQSRLTIELMFEDQYVASMLEQVNVLGASPGVTFLRAATNAQKSNVAKAAINFPPEAFVAFNPIFDLVDYIISSSR